MAQPLDRGNREIIQENAIPREAPEDQRDVYGIQLLFKVLASMCDGQNQMLQVNIILLSCASAPTIFIIRYLIENSSSKILL